ncbi:hypothetical protein GQ600_8184 [Phytophthora cactorum]|nr:hypothetical protein GQ600_8184 [Phytophthora cactorum]
MERRSTSRQMSVESVDDGCAAEFEDIIKDGVAPFVGREGHRIDPLSQISMSCFRLVDCNVDVKSTKVEMDDSIRASTDESADEMPATQPSER